MSTDQAQGRDLEARLRLLEAENERLADRIRDLERDDDVLRRELATRGEAEAALRESEEKFRAAYRTSPDAININRMDRVYVDVNEGFTNLTGYSREEVVGVSSQEIGIWAIPEDRERLIAGLRERGVVEGLESVFRCKDGSLKTALMSARIISLRGEPHILSVTRDITERKRAEEALRESEARFSAFMDHIPAAVFIQDERHRTVYLNRFVREVFDAAGAWPGTRTDGFFPRDLDRSEGEDGPDASASGHEVREEMLVDASGVPRTFQTRRFAIDRGGQTRFLGGFSLDVTEQKRAEEVLRESEARFRTVVENAEAVIFVIDTDGVFRLSEGRSLARLGLRAGEVVGVSALEMYRDYPDVVQSLKKALSGEYSDVTTHVPGLVFDLRCSPLRDSQGRITGVLGVASDITDRVQAEEARLDLERRLLHAQKLESLGVLAGGIAHDFNNLLMAVLGNLEMAATRLSPLSPARVSIDHAVAASKRAADLTRQMLAYSGKGHFVVEELALNELVEENAHMLRAAISKNVTLDVRLGHDVPLIRGDASQLQQVTMNLITNASEALGDAAGVVTLATGVTDCDADCLGRSRLEEKPEPGRFACLEVTDNGCGMDEHTQQQLFDPFFTTKFTGRGLGMSALLGIVRGHGGAILVDSELGRGTAIRVLLPASGASESAKRAATEAAGPAKRRLSGTVLLVDDEPMVRELCAEMLSGFGFDVLCAADGEEAVRVYRERAREIEFVLLDLTMPRMDGSACFQALQGIRPDVKVLLSTGFSEFEVAQQFEGRGLAGIIQKPYTMARLREAFSRALSEGG